MTIPLLVLASARRCSRPASSGSIDGDCTVGHHTCRSPAEGAVSAVVAQLPEHRSWRGHEPAPRSTGTRTTSPMTVPCACSLTVACLSLFIAYKFFSRYVPQARSRPGRLRRRHASPSVHVDARAEALLLRRVRHQATVVKGTMRARQLRGSEPVRPVRHRRLRGQHRAAWQARSFGLHPRPGSTSWSSTASSTCGRQRWQSGFSRSRCSAACRPETVSRTTSAFAVDRSPVRLRDVPVPDLIPSSSPDTEKQLSTQFHCTPVGKGQRDRKASAGTPTCISWITLAPLAGILGILLEAPSRRKQVDQGRSPTRVDGGCR